MKYPNAEGLFTDDFKLENNVVVLRPLLVTDIEGYREVVFDDTIWTYFASGISSDEELTRFITEAIEDRQRKSRVTFTSIHKESGKIAGSTSFGNFSFRDGRVEIGWTWVAPRFRRTGLNKSNKFLLLKYAFEVLNFERVEFKTDVLNSQARKALIGIGATEEGILRSHTLMQCNRRRDTIYYSILKDEWPDIKARIFADYQ